MLILIILGVALWIGCGVISSGLIYGHMTREFDWTRYEKWDWGKGNTKHHHRMNKLWALAQVPTGPFGLLATFVTMRPLHFHFSPPKHWEPYL